MIFIRKLNELYEKEVAGRKKRKNQEIKKEKEENEKGKRKKKVLELKLIHQSI